MHSFSAFTFFFVIFTISIINTEAGILDWFRSRPKWFPKLEKTPLIETFHPRGLRISIGDFNGLQVFDFHGKINEHFNNKYDNGTIRFTLWEPINGRWMYIDKDFELKEGDIFHYWYYIKVNGEEYWSPRAVKTIQNISPYPGEELRFPRFQSNHLCPCDTAITNNNLPSSGYVQCDREEYQNMKKELANSRVQINVLLETLLLLQKSDRNIPTLILTGKSSLVIDPKEDVKRFLKNNLDISYLDDEIRKAHYTDCGILFELNSLIDMERILIAAEKELNRNNKGERRIFEPEKAECSKHEYESIEEEDNDLEEEVEKLQINSTEIK